MKRCPPLFEPLVSPHVLLPLRFRLLHRRRHDTDEQRHEHLGAQHDERDDVRHADPALRLWVITVCMIIFSDAEAVEGSPIRISPLVAAIHSDVPVDETFTVTRENYVMKILF